MVDEKRPRPKITHTQELDPLLKTARARMMYNEVVFLKQPDKNGEIAWTEREEQRLFNSYGKVTKNVLSLLFPDRTHQSIIARASVLRHPLRQLKYTSDEDRLLMDLRSKGIQYNNIAKQFTNRTPGALKKRASRLRRIENETTRD